jgi:hypothetical protein
VGSITYSAGCNIMATDCLAENVHCASLHNNFLCHSSFAMGYLSRSSRAPSRQAEATGQALSCWSVPPPQPTSSESLQVKWLPCAASTAEQFRPPCKAQVQYIRTGPGPAESPLSCRTIDKHQRGHCTSGSSNFLKKFSNTATLDYRWVLQVPAIQRFFPTLFYGMPWPSPPHSTAAYPWCWLHSGGQPHSAQASSPAQLGPHHTYAQCTGSAWPDHRLPAIK